MDTVSQIC